MDEFNNYMKVREILSDLTNEISDIENKEEAINNIDYCIKMLQELKSDIK